MAEGSSGGRIPFGWSVPVVILVALVPERAAALARQADD